ncbi:MAG TPA: TIGR02679 family protein [Clostridiales bacterium]|nr:TIGR02679 family protein [Clostridiales bacterium]
MSPAREAARQLARAGLGDLLVLARQRVEALDGVRGTATLELSPQAREQLVSLLGWRRLPRDSRVRVPLADLDAALRQSRFEVSLLDVLEADAGPVVTRREREEAALARWRGQLEDLAVAVPPAREWIEELDSRGPTARWYRRAYREDPARAAAAALAVARTLGHLPAGGELVAVFAARVTGNPHVLDAGSPAGSLLLETLGERWGPVPEGLRPSEARALLLNRAGLEVDGVSSTVLLAYPGEVTHPVLAAMAEHGGGWPVPLNELRRLTVARARRGVAHVVENPAVFEWLVRAVAAWPPGRRPTLVATGGFLSAAAIQLLDRLHAAGDRLLYGGDFDRNGLTIAGQLAGQYPGLELWRMSAGDYHLAARDGTAPLSPADRDWLNAFSGPLAATARAMAGRRVPAYQEILLEELLTDLGAGERKE